MAKLVAGLSGWFEAMTKRMAKLAAKFGVFQ